MNIMLFIFEDYICLFWKNGGGIFIDIVGVWCIDVVVKDWSSLFWCLVFMLIVMFGLFFYMFGIDWFQMVVGGCGLVLKLLMQEFDECELFNMVWFMGEMEIVMVLEDGLVEVINLMVWCDVVEIDFVVLCEFGMWQFDFGIYLVYVVCGDCYIWFDQCEFLFLYENMLKVEFVVVL